MTDSVETIVEVPERVVLTWVRADITKAQNPIVASFEEWREFPKKSRAVAFARKLLAKGVVWMNTLEMSHFPAHKSNQTAYPEITDISFKGYAGWHHYKQKTYFYDPEVR